MDIPASNHHVGSTERAFVAHVNDLNDFYLHSESIHNSLIKLGQELYNEYCESLTKPLGINETLSVGDYCACPSESQDWYRGLIRQIDSNGHAIVFKIDYGDVQCIPRQFLRPLEERFFKLHRLAFHCSLVNLIKPTNGWPLAVIDEFRSRLTTTFLYARSINYNEIRDISEVEITEKSSKTPLNKDFEQYQMQRSTLHMNDKLVYKYIPMEILDSSQPNQIRILYYISPSRFYVYLREKINSHTSFQIDLQKAIQNLHLISSPKTYQPIAAQDNLAVWHRAVILDLNSDLSKVCVYFIDVGQSEYISINNIRPLPEEFQRKPAFAIPCCLYNVYPSNGNEQSIWKSNDPVHDEFNRLTANNITCQVCAKQDQLYYDVEVDIPKIGDLGTFLSAKNLISRSTMRNAQRSAFSSGQPPQQSFVRAQLLQSGIPPSRQQQQRFTQPSEHHNNSNNMTQQQQTRMLHTGLQNPTLQQSSNIPTNTILSSNIPIVPPQDGYYTIIQVRNAAEFYGLSQNRENELAGLSKHLADYYNNVPNDSSLNVTVYMEGVLCVIQEGDKYHRVIIKHRESESRVSVKLVDRGDEIIVDTSELLHIDNRFSSIPAFAQPFRLRGYDEPQSSAHTTLNLKKLILNQQVHISATGPIINGFYPVDVTLNGNQSVNKMLLSNDKNLSITSPISNNRPNFNQPQPTHIESQVYSNSNRHHSTIGQDLSGGRLDMNQRTNDILPTPQKILTGTARTQPGRFGATANQIPPSNEQISRFSNIGNRNQQLQGVDSTSSNSVWNKDQNNKSNLSGSGLGNEQTFGRQQQQQQPSSSQFGMNQRTDDNKTSIINNQNRFASNNSDNQQTPFEQKRSFSSGFSHDNRNEKQISGNNFQQNNNESGFRRGDGFGNRDRGDHGGFKDRNMGRNNEENNNENNSQSSEGFSKRTEGFADRGGRGGSFQDRNGANRNQGDNHSQNFNSNRGGFHGGRGGGGFPNRQDQGEDGDSYRRGGRGGSSGRGFNNDRGSFGDRGGFGDRSDRGGRGGFGDRNDRGGFGDRGGRGGFGDRGGRGGFGDRSDRGGRGGFGDRGGRGSFGDRGDRGLELSSDDKSFSGWPKTRSTSVNFEAGDRFIESEIPKESFKFVVSHIETTNNFFIQLLSKGDELSSLSEILQTEYKQSPEITLNLFKINLPCLAKSSDGCWYRAVVLSTGLSKLKIRFIDFGDTMDVDSNTIRQIAKKNCSPGPYAYQCTFKNAQVVENVNTANVIDKFVDKKFTGKIITKTSDNKFILESDDLLTFLLEINAIKLKSEVTLKRIKCLIGYIEAEQQEFYIQDDEDTLNKIAKLIQNEETNAPTLSLDEVKQLEPKTIVIARFEDEPYRGIIESDESDENVNICFVDYGNISSCPKNSLKRCSEQLSSYPYQAKHCHLYGASSNEINNALNYLGDNSDSENNIEISIINEKDQIYNVLVYINNQCINEKFGYDPNNDQSSTTIKDQEQISSKKEQDQVSSVKEQEQEQISSVTEQEQISSEREQDQVSSVTGQEQVSSVTEQKHEQVSSVTEQEQEQISSEREQDQVSSVKEQEQVSSVTEQEQDSSVTEQEQEQVSSEKEQEQEQISSVLKQQTNEDVLSQNEDSLDTSTVFKSETEETSPKYRQGFLTHIEKTKPYVYLQLDPKAELIIKRINELIDNIIEKDEHNSSYEIGDHIIAKYSEDENCYRARIESYSSSSELYTVYFLDYGNIDENVPLDHLYSYSDDLNKIEPQARGYLLDKINSEIWNDVVRSLVEENLNNTIEFYFSDENNSIIHLKFDNENDIYNTKENIEPIKSSTTIEQNKTFHANISTTDNDCFYIHILPDGNLRVCEMEEILQICDREHKDSWSTNDLCIVSNEENKYYRGQILEINDKKYNVKCIDYGNILHNITDNHLYVLPDEEIFKQSSLAHQCRLHGIDDENQMKAIEEIIKNIQPTERMTITVENDRNDQCLFVTLVRENNEVVNDRYLSGNNDITENDNKQESDNEEKNEIILPNSSDSAIADTANTDEQSTSQSENTNQSSNPMNVTDNNSLLSITNNQTIDFGENDPSTTIKDETNNSISSN